MKIRKRQIGPVGTGVRVVIGLGLVYLALFDEGEFLVGLGQLPVGLVQDGEWPAWGLAGYEAVLGLVVFPAIMVAVGLFAERYSAAPLRLTGLAGTAVNTALIVILVSIPLTAGAVLLFYGATMLIAAWWGRAGCEATVVSNLAVGRDDQIGCPTLTPIDVAEARLGQRERAAIADAC
jgi:hypothetical protein